MTTTSRSKSKAAHDRWRVGIAGYDVWLDYPYFAEVMNQRYALHGAMTLVHRYKAMSADLCAVNWIKEAKARGWDVEEETYPINLRIWGHKDDPQCEIDLVESGIDEMLIFIATNIRLRPMKPVVPTAVRKCHELGVPVLRVEHDRRKGSDGQPRLRQLRKYQGTRYAPKQL